MASDVSICNTALSWIGGQLITSLDDESREAQLCKAVYEDVRDAVTAAHDWTFAIGRFDLPKNAAAPVNGYANGFQLPSEVLRVMDVNCGEDWRIEGQDIVTNEGSAKIRAVVRITDPTRFSALFVQALAARLAADLAIPLTQSKELQRQHYELYMTKLSEAVTNDGMQGKSRKITSSWLRSSRYRGATLAGPTVGGSSDGECPGG